MTMPQARPDLADQISIRGLKDFGTPLREFTGVLDTYNTELDTKWADPAKGKEGTTRVILSFKDLKVLKSTEPYNFPVAQITINYSERKSSTWGVFSESLAKCIADTEDLKDQKGREFHLELTPGHKFGKDRQTGADIVRDCWEVKAVKGAGVAAGQKSATATALELLDNKTEAEFNQVVFQNAVVKQDSGLFGAILNRTFLPTMLESGKVTRDGDNRYHVVV